MALTINESIGAHDSYRSLKNKRLLNATQLLDKLTLEISTLVCMKPLWYTIVGNKFVEESLSCYPSCLVYCWYGQGILGKVVGYYKHISNALGWFEGQIIHADQLQGCRCGYTDQWFTLLLLVLPSQASVATLDPSFCICVHVKTSKTFL